MSLEAKIKSKERLSTPDVMPNSPPIKLIIPDVPPSPNRVLGKHWSTKAGIKGKWILWIRSQHIPWPIRLMVQKRVKITLFHSRIYDQDNAYAACKPVLDAMKHWNLIWDDSPEYADLTVMQERCPHKQRHTIIELEAVRAK